MKSLLQTLNGKIISPPPVWLMRQAGRHLPEYLNLRSQTDSFLDFCYSPDMAVEATLQPILRYGMDAAILFSDILVIPDALGQRVSFIPGHGPRLEPLDGRADINRLDPSNLHAHLAPVYAAIRRIRTRLPKTTTLIGFAGAPWTVATYMIEGGGSRDCQKTRTYAYETKDDFQALIDLLVDTTSSYLIRQADEGAEVVQIFDSWAGVLPPMQFDDWVIKPFQKIVAAVKTVHPNLPIIGFPKGAGLGYATFATQTGVDAVSLDSMVPLVWAAENVQPHTVIQGNLDNLVLRSGGQLLEAAVQEILTVFSARPFIFNLGHGILPETPVSHVEQLLDIIRRN
ncbi:MAG: uroporphyrinogen decarboxylase [Rhodospirillaceae bacterium]|nr:uroporphyrinogen decarboxylase [Rhodospirillaceae bacterium]